ncbi:hypothetical protein J6590_098002, partial [Homalodisca vitripennis]
GSCLVRISRYMAARRSSLSGSGSPPPPNKESRSRYRTSDRVVLTQQEWPLLLFPGPYSDFFFGQFYRFGYTGGPGLALPHVYLKGPCHCRGACLDPAMG